MTAEKKTDQISCRKGGRLRGRSFRLLAGTAALLTVSLSCLQGGAIRVSAAPASGQTEKSEDKVTLRIANWEEYIDEGDWDEEEAIDLDDREGTVILGENSMVEDFEEW